MMKVMATCMVLWFMIGGSWPWLVLAFLFWEFGGNAALLGSVWLSGKFGDHDHEP